MAIMADLHAALGLERGTPRGAPPLRSRALPFGLGGLSERSQASCRAGTELFFRHLDLADGVATAGGDATTEHPVDPGCTPHGRFPKFHRFFGPRPQYIEIRHRVKTNIHN